MRPLISIITVSYNSVETIEETIRSVIEQDFKNYEYIIIDGGSIDGTVDIIEKYRKYITYYSSEKDSGIYEAMNKGIAKVTGQFTYFIGSDDTFSDARVLTNVSNYLKDPSIIYYGDVHFTTKNIRYDGKFNMFKIVTRNISHQSAFYPSNIFTTLKFEIKYKIFADYAMNLKLFNSKKYSFQYFPILVSNFNDQGASGLNTKDLIFERDFLTLIKDNFPFYIYFYRIVRAKISKMIKR